MATPKYYNEEGWRDNISQFITKNIVGITEPGYSQIGTTGLYAAEFANGEESLLNFHIDHDVKPGGQSHLHIHFAPTTAPGAGQVVTWTFTFVSPKGHDQETFNVAPTVIAVDYTFDGTEPIGQHLIAEDSSGITTPEVDSLLLCKVTYDDGTYNNPCWGLTADIHYEVDRNSTPNKAPDFYA